MIGKLHLHLIKIGECILREKRSVTLLILETQTYVQDWLLRLVHAGSRLWTTWCRKLHEKILLTRLCGLLHALGDFGLMKWTKRSCQQIRRAACTWVAEDSVRTMNSAYIWGHSHRLV